MGGVDRFVREYPRDVDGFRTVALPEKKTAAR